MPPLTPEEKKFLTDVLGIPAFLLDWDVAALTSGAAAGSTPPFSPYGAKPFRHPTPDPMRMREDHDDPGISPPIPRAQVEERLKVFLHDIQADQKGHSVKIDDRVRAVGHALADGLGPADTQMSSLLHDESRNHDADELAGQMAAVLPDAVPAENYGRFLQKANVGNSSKAKPSIVDRARNAARKIIDGLGQTPDGGDSPTDHSHPPGPQPTIGPVRPDDHIQSAPSVPIPGT